MSPSVKLWTFLICSGVTHPLRRRQSYIQYVFVAACLPMLVGPTSVLLDGEEGAETEFSILDFDACLLAFGVLAHGTCIGREL